jgi:DDE superfamily endonuclease
MKTNEPSQPTREQRFAQYVALLSEAVDRPDRAEPLRDYCTELLLPIARKSIEPIAAEVAPGKVPAKHQSLQQFITDAPRRDQPLLGVARQYALPALLRHGGVQATLVIEWPEGEPEPTKYFLSTLPKTTSLKRLVETVKRHVRTSIATGAATAEGSAGAGA